MKPIVSILVLFTILYSINLAAQKSKSKNYYLSDAKSVNEIVQINNKVERVANLFIGHFAKYNKETGTINQELVGRRIWKKRSGEIWIYLGWFKADFMESPINVFISKISQIAPDTILMESFDFPNKEKYTGAWKEKEPFLDLVPGDLVVRPEGCRSYLIDNGDNKFKLFSQNLCYNPLSSAIEFSMTNGELDPKSLRIVTKFYDKEKKLLFESDGNKFIRSDKDKPKYK